MQRAGDRDGDRVHLGFLELALCDRGNLTLAGINYRGRTRHWHVQPGAPDEEGSYDPLAA
jgi:hypothetical protein